MRIVYTPAPWRSTRRTAGIPVPDALIAATALAHEMAVMTRNRRHFELVPGLTLQAPAA
jgi:predicted nucleic acid-binding protein